MRARAALSRNNQSNPEAIVNQSLTPAISTIALLQCLTIMPPHIRGLILGLQLHQVLEQSGLTEQRHAPVRIVRTSDDDIDPATMIGRCHGGRPGGQDTAERPPEGRLVWHRPLDEAHAK